MSPALRGTLAGALLFSLGLAVGHLAFPSAQAGDEPADRFFEMRTYTTHPDKLEALHDRFRDHTNRLFEKHGMDLVGYWTPAGGPEADNTLVFILGYPDREAREQSWEAFVADPEWQEAYEESHRDGPLVSEVDSRFLVPTDYSPIR